MSVEQEESVSDEMLMALADGELDQAQAALLRERIARDAALQERYAIFTGTTEALRAAFPQTETPDRLITNALTGPVDEDRRAEATSGVVLPLRPRIAVPLALAASLAVGVGIGWGLKGPDSQIASLGLEQVARDLENVPTGQSQEVTGFGAARVLGSFETQHGLCRLIAVQSEDSSDGRFVTCRQGGDWYVALSVTDGPGGGFVPASDASTEMIDLYLDTIGAGPALDRLSETRTLEKAD